MKNGRLTVAVTCLVVATALFLADATVYAASIGRTTVTVYPALFFGLVGVVQLVRHAWR